MALSQALSTAVGSARLRARVVAPTRRPVCVVFGNCQALILQVLLERDERVGEAYRVLRLPAAHEIRPADVPALHRAVRRADALVVQRVRDGYRDLPVGTAELQALLPAGARTVLFPTLYYQGMFPYQVDVRHLGHLSEAAPITAYHDLRCLAAAAHGWPTDEAVARILDHRLPAEAVVALSKRSVAESRRREAELDVAVADRIEGRDASFFTMNHPGDALLHEVKRQVATLMDVETSTAGDDPREDLLGQVRAPVDAGVLEALGLDVGGERRTWMFNGVPVESREVVERHLAYYRERPEILRSGLRQHAERLEEIIL